MPEIVKQRVSGGTRRLTSLRSDDNPREIVITIVEGQTLPEGTLAAVAVSGDDEIVLDAADELGSGSGDQDVIRVTLDPYDFEYYGSQRWAIEVTITDDSEPSAEFWTAYVLFSGTVVFVEEQPRIIQSTLIQEVGSS